MRRILGVLIAILLVLALPGSVAAAPVQPRVAVIVGPAGSLTDFYRSVGAAAAREARRWTSDVVTVFSPNATWPAARRALRGASVVVYLGHGNGWPSPYRDSPYPASQNGLGLNPVAGGDDSAHQYFGESFLAREVRLAPGAVVLLHHLCYASGNSEPGLAEGALDVAKQRVDNYAAGWLRAGAGAVVADTFGDPEPYLRALFGTNDTIAGIWHDAPTFHDHVLTFPSVRTPGHEALMDPTRVTSGFNRSLVWQPGLRAGDVRAGAGRVATGSSGPIPPVDPPPDSLAAIGITFRAPALAPVATARGLVAGTRVRLTVPFKVPPGVSLPSPLKVGVRWDPLALAPVVAPAAIPGGSTGDSTGGSIVAPTPTPGPATSPGPDRGGRPAPDASPIVVPTPSQPPAVDPVAPEVLGSVVTPTRAVIDRGRLRATISLPAAPGTYRLVTTIHSSDGVALDAATQALVPGLAVRVSPQLSVAYGVVPGLDVVAGTSVTLPVRVVNDGSMTWIDRPGASSLPDELIDPSVARARPDARLVARWVILGLDDPGSAPADASAPATAAPGTEITVRLVLTAPATPGTYLLLLDLVSPVHGSLAASGVGPGQVRVTVRPAATPGGP